MANIEDDGRISDEVARQVNVAVGSGIDFVDVEQVQTAVDDAGVPEDEGDAIVEDYAAAQLQALKAGLLAAAVLALISLASTGGLPATVPSDDEESEDEMAPDPVVG